MNPQEEESSSEKGTLSCHSSTSAHGYLAHECLSSSLQVEVHNSAGPLNLLPYSSRRLSSGCEANKSFSQALHSPNGRFSRSSTFCTSQFSSSSPVSEAAHSQLKILPFLPSLPKTEQPTSSAQSSSSPLILRGSLRSVSGESDDPDALIKGLLNLSQDASDGSFHEENYANDCVTFDERLELQILSDELGMAIAGSEESPRLDVSIVFRRLFYRFLHLVQG